MTNQVDWNAVAAVAAAISALVAAWELHRSRIARERDASFDSLREIQEKSTAASSIHAPTARAEIAAWNAQQSDSLSPAGHAYLDYLNTFDRILYAMEKRQLSPEIVTPWIKGLLKPNRNLVEFIRTQQLACDDDCLHQYLLDYLTKVGIEHEKENRRDRPQEAVSPAPKALPGTLSSRTAGPDAGPEGKNRIPGSEQA
jgi:hypothetical protein